MGITHSQDSPLVAEAGWRAEHVNHDTGQFTVVWDGGGSALQANKWVDIPAAHPCTITSWTLTADQSGSATIGIAKAAYADLPPTSSIVASAKPTLSGAIKATSSALTGWTISVAAGDWLRFNLDTAATITKLTLVVAFTRTA